MVSGFDQRFTLFVLGLIGFGVLDHLFDIGIRQAAIGLNADRMFLIRRLILGIDVNNPIGVDIEGNFDLRYAARCRWNALQVELTQHLIVRSDRTFALEDADGHSRLIIVRRREDL